MVEQHFCLRWNNYRTNITAEFETLREGEHFVDVTLACDGQQLKAHKVVLSACSPYFKDLLQANPCTHPIIILRDVAYTHMRSLLEFMYAGEVNISQTNLTAFLHTAEALKIRGLAESSDERKEMGGCSTVSPLSALKSSLSGGLGIGGLGGLPLLPQLLPHHAIIDAQGPPLPSHLPQHLVPPPPPLSLPSSSALQRPSPPPPITSSISSSMMSSTPPISASNNGSTSSSSSRIHQPTNSSNGSIAPLQLTVQHPYTRTESPPPLSLPPHKRLRCDPSKLPPTTTTSPHDNYSSDKPTTFSSNNTNNNNNSNTTNNNSNSNNMNGTTSSTSSTITNTSIGEDGLEQVPKIEPCDSVASDNEASVWPDDNDPGTWGGHMGGDGMATPGPTPPGSTPPHSDNATSHLLSALKSESPLQGGGVPDDQVERPYITDNPRSDYHHDLRPDHRDRDRDVRLDLRNERNSPPLPPSSLPHSCQLCGKLISCRRNLWKHMERVHFTNPAVRCSLCAKMFKNKYALKDHQRIYHGGLSEPQHPGHSGSPGSASLLSRILHDSSRHHPPPPSHSQPHEPRSPIDMHQVSSHSHRPNIDVHSPYPHRRQPEEDESVGNIPSYGNMPMGPLLPPSLSNSTMVPGPHRSEWTAQDDPMSLVTRAALISEIHHMVTKPD